MALDLLPFPAFGGSVNPLLQPPYRLLLRGPVATGPQRWVRRIGPFSKQSHRLTSPMLRALLRFLPAKTSRTESPWVAWRLHPLRGWSHEQSNTVPARAA